jgi:hypothetical protein
LRHLQTGADLPKNLPRGKSPFSSAMTRAAAGKHPRMAYELSFFKPGHRHRRDLDPGANDSRQREGIISTD